MSDTFSGSFVGCGVIVSKGEFFNEPGVISETFEQPDGSFTYRVLLDNHRSGDLRVGVMCTREDVSHIYAPEEKVMRYILVYEDTDFPEYGGGTYVECYSTEVELDLRVNTLSGSMGDRFKFIKAGYLSQEYKYKPVQYAVRYEKELVK